MAQRKAEITQGQIAPGIELSVVLRRCRWPDEVRASVADDTVAQSSHGRGNEGAHRNTGGQAAITLTPFAPRRLGRRQRAGGPKPYPLARSAARHQRRENRRTRSRCSWGGPIAVEAHLAARAVPCRGRIVACLGIAGGRRLAARGARMYQCHRISLKARWPFTAAPGKLFSPAAGIPK
jgi:hypothetical protein